MTLTKDDIIACMHQTELSYLQLTFIIYYMLDAIWSTYNNNLMR